MIAVILQVQILVNAECLDLPAELMIMTGVQFLDLFYNSNIRTKLTCNKAECSTMSGLMVRALYLLMSLFCLNRDKKQEGLSKLLWLLYATF